MQRLRRLHTLKRFALEASRQDDQIALHVAQYLPMLPELGYVECVTFSVIQQSSGEKAGEIALRLGDNNALFYLGHIGYHIDPGYRGHHYALRACRMCLPLIKEAGLGSVVITTDEDNGPSIKTCERLGCQLESTVDVPRWCQRKFQISQRKRRYVLVLA